MMSLPKVLLAFIFIALGVAGHWYYQDWQMQTEKAEIEVQPEVQPEVLPEVRRWQLDSREALIIGEYGHNFAYDGENVRSVEGSVTLDVDSVSNTGEMVAILKGVRHQFSKDEILEGEVKLVMNNFSEEQIFHDGGIAENVWLHGDSGNAAPVMPQLFNLLAGWGSLDIYVDDELKYEGLVGHFMYTERARRDGKIVRDEDGTIYSPKIAAEMGFTDPTAREFHIVTHTTDPDDGNFPPHTQWMHLNFQDVALRLAPEDAVLFVP